MPKIKYVNKNFRGDTLSLIEQANDIIAEYQRDGYTLTLRQLYYQFVARDILPNTQKNYKRLGTVISDGRLAGMIDWTALEDRTRNISTVPSWDSPTDIIRAVSNSYNEDKWKDQPYRIEVWIEKEALAGVFERVCAKYQIPFFCCRGYTSQSEMWGASMRMRRHNENGQGVVILHFGDHDPSGIDMTRDVVERLELFRVKNIELRRLALNMNQIDTYNPPPNPAKDVDPRFADYMKKFGDESWELDALDPKTLAALVDKEIRTIIEQKKWTKSMGVELTHKNELRAIYDNYGEIVTYAQDQGWVEQAAIDNDDLYVELQDEDDEYVDPKEAEADDGLD